MSAVYTVKVSYQLANTIFKLHSNQIIILIITNQYAISSVMFSIEIIDFYLN